MRHGFIVALTACLTGAGAALAEAPAAPVPSTPPAVDARQPEAPGCPECDAPVCGPRVWGGAEYLLWWIKDAPVPVPLVTTGPSTPTVGDRGGVGVLGLPGTTTLLGGDNVGFGPFSGGRFTLGAWLTDDQRFGVEGNYFFLAQQSKQQSVSSSGLVGSTNLGIPFINLLTGREDSDILSRAPDHAGTATLSLSSRLQGAELNALFGLTDPCRAVQVHLVGGFRYVNLNEDLTFDTSSPMLQVIPTITRFTNDDFGTDNNFYGGQLGVRGDYTWGRFELQAAAKCAIGVMTESVRINGSSAIEVSNIPFGNGSLQTFRGGAFALPTNMGRFSQNRFAAVPEGDVKLSYQVTDHVAVSAGYSFLYLSDVVRPGDQIDRKINPTQSADQFGPGAALSGTPGPLPRTSSSDFWAQGVNFGLEFKF